MLSLPKQAAAQPYGLYSVAKTRAVEATHVRLPSHESLMQSAGLAIAQLVIALRPHAKTIWIACGPGNNGGDGLEAAAQLARLGKAVFASDLIGTRHRQGDAQKALQSAHAAGVLFIDTPPENFDLCVDALFGIGQALGFGAPYESYIKHINASHAQVLAVDVPSGLDADTGVASDHCIRADFTLSLLTLKPGLFTADGRAMAGDIWINELTQQGPTEACAQLSHGGIPRQRPHNTHKGSFGDVAVIGGDDGMVGAAILAGRAALQGGAGRVFIGLLAKAAPSFDEVQPELMIRSIASLSFEHMSVVAGCGGGKAIAHELQRIIKIAKTLVLDADALNHLGLSNDAQASLAQRNANSTVLTPHPLEAARLLHTTVNRVQANRLGAAQTLAELWRCIVVLKGSGTIIARPGATPTINSTGNALLATGGTGDVLAGLIGSYLAQGMEAFDAANMAVFRHGQVADTWPAIAGCLSASRLAQAL